MAIRLRRTEAGLVALCAARSVAKEGDIYLDDEIHYALAQKFWLDYASDFSKPIVPNTEVVEAIWNEESDNKNRTLWDRAYGKDNELNKYFKFLLNIDDN